MRIFIPIIAADIFVVALSFVLAALLMADGAWSLSHPGGLAAHLNIGEIALRCTLVVGIFAFGDLYRRTNWTQEEIRIATLGLALVALMDCGLSYLKDGGVLPGELLLGWAIAMLAIVPVRMLVRHMGPVARALQTNVVLVGSGTTPAELLRNLKESGAGSYRIVEHLPCRALAFSDARGIAVRMAEIAHAHGCDPSTIEVVLAPAEAEQTIARNLIAGFESLDRPLLLVVGEEGLTRRDLYLRTAPGSDFAFAELHHRPPSAVEKAVKRAFDLVVTSILLVVLAPLFLVIALLLLSSGGSVFFSQWRVGQDGRRFKCLKFRTMRPDAEALLQDLLERDPEARREWQTYQKLRNDPRIIFVGSVLRQTSLDELPQLWNVLKGEMSLVGPRPIVAPEVPGYASDHAYYHGDQFRYYRQCRPGITGLWQVSGRTETTHDERIRLDRWYARNQSIWLDLLILLRTVRSVCARSGR